MPDVAKLKKKAAEYELKKQFDKALAAYVEILDSYDKHSDEEVDLALFNRVGDLYLKQGSVAEAVDYYEQAVDRYAEGGFFNNAIALCNKILRNSPGRASVYYKLGKISAHKGFKGDAKANFLEYADRMQKAGKIDESFRALKEFADLCPDQDDIRLMLADQLSRKGRGPEAIEQLQTLYERYTQEGRTTEANATIERMKAIDPASEPRAAADAPRRAAGDLVFLDLNDSASHGHRSTTAMRAMAGLDLLATGDHEKTATPPPAPAPVAAAIASPVAAPRPAFAPAPPPAPAPAPEPSVVPAPVSAPVSAPASAPAPALEPEPVAELEMLDVDFEPDVPPAAAERELAAAPDAMDALATIDFDVPHATDSTADLPMFDTDVGSALDDGATDVGVGEPTGTGGLLDGLETTSVGADSPVSSGSLLDLEPTSFGGPSTPPPRQRTTTAPPPGLGDDLLDFELPEQRSTGPREVAPREVLRGSAPPRSATPPAARPVLDDLPMLDDGPSGVEVTIGGDLELYMPEEEIDERDVAAARLRTPAEPMRDLPLMDLDLPVVDRRAAAPEIGVPSAHDLEAIDISMPSFETSMPVADAPPARVTVPVREVTPAELDVRAELELEEAPVADVSGIFDAVRAPRRSTMMAVHSVEMLRAAVEGDPDDHLLRRQLGEALLESGDREGGIGELEAAMIGYERNDELTSAASIADEIVHLNPGSVRHHQKRVEYAFRTNERGRLIEAYLQLADALFRAEQIEKSRAIYQRVLDLSPDDLRANAALQSFPDPEPEPVVAPPVVKGRQSVAAPRTAASPAPVVGGDDDFINLGDWLRDDAGPMDTRMIVEEKEPTGDEEADFQDMLRKFKQGIAENVEEEDHQSHYDLGVAYKEMGLLDEAIAEFQKALRGPVNRVATYEALGQCFIEKEQYPMGATILQRALQEKGVSDDQLVGVLYLLGLCAEQRGQHEQAVGYYQRVFVIDIQFRDVGDRLAAVENHL
jgi:tetratricopeptide (TPR) repeat protein